MLRTVSCSHLLIFYSQECSSSLAGGAAGHLLHSGVLTMCYHLSALSGQCLHMGLKLLGAM